MGAAIHGLHGNGLRSLRVRIRTSQHGRTKPDDIISFFQQFGTLLAAGTPLLRALQITREQCESTSFANILRRLTQSVSAGNSLHDAMGKHPSVFETQWVEMIKAGERSGQLLGTVVGLADYIKTRRSVRTRVTSAMIYPCVLMVVLVGSLAIMLGKVVPTFAAFLTDFGTELPAITQTVIWLSDCFKRYLGLLVSVPIFTGLAVRSYLRTPSGARRWDVVMIRLPIWGTFMVESAMERFTHNLSLLLESGTPLLEALSVIAKMFTRHGVYASAVGTACHSVGKGSPLGTSLEQTGLFTPLVVNMIHVGEQAGNLTTVLDEVASYYRARVDVRIGRLMSMLEPAIVIILGITVGVILLSVYLPMFEMASGPGG